MPAPRFARPRPAESIAATEVASSIQRLSSHGGRVGLRFPEFRISWAFLGTATHPKMNTPISTLLAEKRHDVLSVSPDATVLEAVSLMNERRVGSVVVLEGGKLVGIFTERDVLRRIVAEQRDPMQTRVRDVMTRDLVTVGSSTEVQQAMAVINEKKLRHLPVIDEGRLVGLISSGDINRHVTQIFKAEAGSLMCYITGAQYGV